MDMDLPPSPTRVEQLPVLEQQHTNQIRDLEERLAQSEEWLAEAEARNSQLSAVNDGLMEQNQQLTNEIT